MGIYKMVGDISQNVQDPGIRHKHQYLLQKHAAASSHPEMRAFEEREPSQLWQHLRLLKGQACALVT